MVAPKDINQTPPGLWRWVHPQSGYKFGGAHGLGRLLVMIREYNQANGYTDPLKLDHLVIQYMCEQEPDWCVSSEPPTLKQRAQSFARAAVDWVSSGFKVVPNEEYERRLEICHGCHYFRGVNITGFGACAKCGCSGLKLFLPTQSCPDNPPRWKAYV